MRFLNTSNYLLVIAAALLLAGCATYYERNIVFQDYVRQGEMEKAEKYLDKDKKIQKDRNRLLYLFNKGFLNHLQQNYAESNSFFNEADLLIEDYRKQHSTELLALISNPEVKPYRAEDFEAVFVHYYKALNYVQRGQTNEAMIEARRINLKLQQLNDKYPKHKNRYSDDAFAHILMGLIYEAGNDFNNAFIAYRNAVALYEKDGGSAYFGTAMPDQLKRDIIRTAHIMGFSQEKAQFEKKFNMTYEPKEAASGGELVFFWQNGFGPVKGEWSINFTILPGEAGMVTFVNEDYGINFPFYLGNGDKDKESGLEDLRIIRVAFPKYIERKKYFNSAAIVSKGKSFHLDEVENVNEIAFKTLEDRFLREMANSLLRLAIKQVAAAQLGKENEALGALASVAGALTEKADTRNWQTLPYAVHYTRVPLDAGENKVQLKLNGPGQQDVKEFTFDGVDGRTQFFPYHSIESLPPGS